jgi:hypothetical protein
LVYQQKELAMKHYGTLVTAAVLAGVAIGPALGGEAPSSSTDPGFKPATGQLNSGDTTGPWSAAPPTAQAQRPPQEEARAALMMPDPGTPPVGAEPAQSGGQQTTGAGVPTAMQAPAGPIGATVQTMPAKFSKRNDLLDHVPVVAWPLRVDAQQRQQIYQAVMGEKSQPAANADALKSADSLSYDQMGDVHPLPQQLADIDALRGLDYVKGKDKVLLVRSPTRIVVDEITM